MYIVNAFYLDAKEDCERQIEWQKSNLFILQNVFSVRNCIDASMPDG